MASRSGLTGHSVRVYGGLLADPFQATERITMSDWGSKSFVLTGLNFGKSSASELEQAVTLLPARVRQAFYGAAMRKGIIARKTWNGCAFNAGSLENEIQGKKIEGKLEVTQGVAGYTSAAEVFNISPYKVSRFISAWDTSPYASDKLATEALVEILERIGIFNDPDKPTVKIVTHTVYEGNMTDAQLLASFKEELTNPEFSFPELLAMDELLGV